MTSEMQRLHTSGALFETTKIIGIQDAEKH